MLDHCLRHCPNVEPALHQHVCQPWQPDEQDTSHEQWLWL